MVRNPSFPHLGRIVPLRVAGFTFIEMLVGSVIVAIAVAGAVALQMGGTRIRGRTEAVDRQQALIDDDVSRIRELARNYTWCSGVASFVDPTTCSGGPGQEGYYSPAASGSTTPQAMTNFENACRTVITPATTPPSAPRTNLINALINQINLTTPNGELVRADVVPDGAPFEQRIRLTYTNAPNNTGITVSRVVTLIPPVANWCP